MPERSNGLGLGPSGLVPSQVRILSRALQQGEKNEMETNVHLKLLIASLRKKSDFWNEVSDKLSVPARKRVTVNLGSLNEYADGETVVIPGKLVAGGQLTKKLNIACWRFSEAVLGKVKQSGSKLVSLHDLSAKDEKGNKLRIIA